ncbi:MAG TPA: hypothetical protein VFR63_04235 [Gaiellaceae bacterium]|nr:hypothetical protein [Gaiellaceae bacterium]
MALAERVDEIVRGLPRGWERARLEVTVEEDEDGDRAALILGPATPGRTGTSFTIYVHGGTRRLAPTPELVRRVVARLDSEGIRARVRLAGHEEADAEPAGAGEPSPQPGSLAESWDALVGRLPSDWTDLYAEVELGSSDYLERGALLLAPVNPARYGGTTGLRFRSARRGGYGVAPAMARRALERLDDESITGSLRALRVLSDTSSTFTQGPVWRVEGRSV